MPQFGAEPSAFVEQTTQGTTTHHLIENSKPNLYFVPQFRPETPVAVERNAQRATTHHPIETYIIFCAPVRC